LIRKLLDSPAFYFFLAGVLLVAALLSQFERVGADAPGGRVEDLRGLAARQDLNVVFILIDTLRADRVHSYGYARETSPTLDSLAARGIRFDDVESQSSWTKASMASLWTGMYPERTGVHLSSHALPVEAIMPAERFRDAGYRTAGIWRNGWVANNFGFDRGFDFYYRPSPNRPVNPVQVHNPSSRRLQGTDLDATQSAVEFILGNRNSPFFLYLHYMDVHQYLYSDSSPAYGSSLSDIYDSALHWTDQNIALLLETLRTEELLDKTILVIASDHGEAFFEHGGEGHARNLYAETQRVPLIIVPPFHLEPGVVVQEPVANVDLWPTILELVGLEELPHAQGHSLLPLILAAAGAGESQGELQGRPLFAQLDRSWGRGRAKSNAIVSMRKEPHRFIYYRNHPEAGELFDHSSDPREQQNLVLAEAETADAFRKSVEAFLAEPRPEWAENREVELDEMMRAQLRALGYVLPSTDVRGAIREKREAEKTDPKREWNP
jgi:arylsulfatase A-like enzyme